MKAVLLMYCISLSLWARDPSETRQVPTDFAEIDFGLVKFNDTMTTTVTSPCGITSASSRGGLWSVRQQAPQAVIRANVTKNYRDKHRGDFTGTYKICGSGGSGAPIAPIWAGSANAGKRILPPMTNDLMFIRQFGPGARSVAEDSALRSYLRTHLWLLAVPSPYTSALFTAQVTALGITLQALYASANPEAPATFADEQAFDTGWLAQKQFRDCNKGTFLFGVDRKGEIPFYRPLFAEQRVGYTPVPGGFFTQGAAGPGSNTLVLQGSTQVVQTRDFASRISFLGFTAAAFDGSIPFIWSTVTHSATAEGKYQTTITGSFFPTHRIYTSSKVDSDKEEPLDYRSRTSMPQRNDRLGEFIFETGWFVRVRAHPAGPIVYSGDAEAL